jgi:hypothetical protein
MKKPLLAAFLLPAQALLLHQRPAWVGKAL